MYLQFDMKNCIQDKRNLEKNVINSACKKYKNKSITLPKDSFFILSCSPFPSNKLLGIVLQVVLWMCESRLTKASSALLVPNDIFLETEGKHKNSFSLKSERKSIKLALVKDL